MLRRIVTIGLVAVLGTGCYHATIETGATPSTQVIDKPWAHSWVFGLVPPTTLETTQRCSNGVARVETQLTFVNQLVSFLTSGIYTPMAIKVTCASAGSAGAAQAGTGSTARQ